MGTRAGLLSTFPKGIENKRPLEPLFRIITEDLPHHDGKNIVFGTVLEGMDIVWYMESLDRWQTDNRSLPVECRIVDSGEIELEKPFRDETPLEQVKFRRPHAGHVKGRM